jgi:hypothetical protein
MLPCGCTDREIFILYKLWRGHKFNPSATYQIKKLQNTFQLEFGDIPGPGFDETIQSLLNDGLLAKLQKKGKMRFGCLIWVGLRGAYTRT